MSLAKRLLMGSGASWAPPALHVRTPALDDYTPTSTITIPSDAPYNDDSLHPSVVDTVTGWNGHRYWMAYTPLPGGVEPLENPFIAVSEDGDSWAAPAGITNPIDPPPSDGYNSDTDLVLAEDEGLLYCFYRHIGSGGGMKLRTSADGVQWSNETVFDIGTAQTIQRLSPSWVRLSASSWRVWWISLDERKVYTASAASATGTYTSDVLCNINLPGGVQPWHVDVIRHDGLYFMLIYAEGGSEGSCVVGGVSYDGINWGDSTDILMRSRTGFGPLYRATLVPASGGFDVWISGAIGAGQNRLGRSFIPDAEFA